MVPQIFLIISGGLFYMGIRNISLIILRSTFLVSMISILPEQSMARAAAACDADAVKKCTENLNPYRREDACACMSEARSGCAYEYDSGNASCSRTPISWWKDCPKPEAEYFCDSSGVKRKRWKPVCASAATAARTAEQKLSGYTLDSLAKELASEGRSADSEQDLEGTKCSVSEK